MRRRRPPALAPTATVSPASGGEKRTVRAGIDVRDVSLQPVGDDWQGRLDVWLAQLGPGDELLDTVSHVAGLSLDRPTFEQVMRSGELPLMERLKRDRRSSSGPRCAMS